MKTAPLRILDKNPWPDSRAFRRRMLIAETVVFAIRSRVASLPRTTPPVQVRVAGQLAVSGRQGSSIDVKAGRRSASSSNAYWPVEKVGTTLCLRSPELSLAAEKSLIGLDA